MRNERDCLAGALTLLCKRDILTTEEVDGAMKEGYSGLFELLNHKYVEITQKEESKMG